MNKAIYRFWGSIILLGMLNTLLVNATTIPAYAEETNGIKGSVGVHAEHVFDQVKSGILSVATLSGGSQSQMAKAFALSNPATAAEAGALARTLWAPMTAITDSGDGVRLLEYPDNNGFEIHSGGCSVIYDRKTKTMKLIDENGACRQVRFSR
jgi:hypothetical protein